MTSIEWNSKYELGSDQIDTQHQILFNIIKKLNQAKNDELDKQYIESLYSELLKFSEFHFCSEENIMIENSYPGYISHRKEHEKVLSDLRNRLFSLKYEYIDFANLETFLIDWFSHHTSTEDAQLVAFLKDKEAL